MAEADARLVFLDPPYHAKGRDLYYDLYKHDDHANVAKVVQSLQHVSWVVSYDDAPSIHAYGGKQCLQYSIGYSARERTQGREAMFFSSNLQLPAAQGSMVEIDRLTVSEDNRGRSTNVLRSNFGEA